MTWRSQAAIEIGGANHTASAEEGNAVAVVAAVSTAVLLDNRSQEVGWTMGFEPTTAGITIRGSNQLSYVHHRRAVCRVWRARQDSNLRPSA